MTQLSKKQMQAVRDGITAVSSKLSASALHISAICDSKDYFICIEKLSSDQFKAVTGVDRSMWISFCNKQNDNWKSLVQANFELQLESQLRKFNNLQLSVA